MHATRSPDGAFLVQGSRYTLLERSPGLFDVVADTGGIIGRLKMVSHRRSGPSVEAFAGAAEPEVVEAIGQLLGQPRGSLPLQ